MQYRDGEEPKSWYRFERFFLANGGWYFTTREGEDVGPFGSKLAAQRGVKLFIKYTQQEVSSSLHASKMARDGLWRSTLFR